MATAVASVTLSLSRYRTRKTIADRKSDRSCSRAERINGPSGRDESSGVHATGSSQNPAGARGQNCEDVGTLREQNGDAMVSARHGRRRLSYTPGPCPHGGRAEQKGSRIDGPAATHQPASALAARSPRQQTLSHVRATDRPGDRAPNRGQVARAARAYAEAGTCRGGACGRTGGGGSACGGPTGGSHA